MSKFLELNKLFIRSLGRFITDISQALANFRYVLPSLSKSENAKSLAGFSASEFASRQHTHPYVRFGQPAIATKKLLERSASTFALRNHEHDYVREDELVWTNTTEVPLIRSVAAYPQSAVPVGTTELLSDGENYYISALPQRKGILFTYGEPLEARSFIEFGIVLRSPECTLELTLLTANEEFKITLVGNRGQVQVLAPGSSRTLEAQLDSLRVRIEPDQGLKLSLVANNTSLFSARVFNNVTWLRQLSIVASSPSSNLVRLDTPKIYRMIPDPGFVQRTTRYLVVENAELLNQRPRESFARAQHNHDGFYERAVDLIEGKRIARAASYYVKSIGNQGDIAPMSVEENALMVHPLEIFAKADHSHGDRYARRGTRVARARALYTSKGSLEPRHISKVEHSHPYATNRGTNAFAVKPAKQLSSTTVLGSQRLRLTLVRYIQTFKTWARNVSFFSAKHLPKGLFTTDGYDPFPQRPANKTIDATNQGIDYNSNTVDCGPLFGGVKICRNKKKGPNPGKIINSNLRQLLVPSTFWEATSDPTSMLEFRFRKVDGTPLENKVLYPSRYHIAFVSKEKFEDLARSARGKLIVDTNQPVTKSAQLTFFESIVSSAEAARQSARNVMPAVLTETSGAYWVAVLPPKYEQSASLFERVVRSIIVFIDSIIYFVVALVLLVIAFIEQVSLWIHTLITDIIADIALYFADLSQDAMCICILGNVISLRDFLLDTANYLWDFGVSYWRFVFFVPSVSVLYSNGLVPLVFYRTRPNPSETDTKLFDKYPTNPLYPEEHPGTIGVNQGYATTVAYVLVGASGVNYVYAGAFTPTTGDPVAFVSRFAANYVRYFGVLGVYAGVDFPPFSQRVDDTPWAVLLSYVPYSAQEVGFGVLPAQGGITVLNCGHPFNLLIMQKGA